MNYRRDLLLLDLQLKGQLFLSMNTHSVENNNALFYNSSWRIINNYWIASWCFEIVFFFRTHLFFSLSFNFILFILFFDSKILFLLSSALLLNASFFSHRTFLRFSLIFFLSSDHVSCFQEFYSFQSPPQLQHTCNGAITQLLWKLTTGKRLETVGEIFTFETGTMWTENPRETNNGFESKARNGENDWDVEIILTLLALGNLK